MEFNGIEHYDVFEGDVIVFWADISNPPQAIQTAAQEIAGPEFSPEFFGICVNYSFAEKEFYVVLDTGVSEKDYRNIFYIDQDGDKHWFKTDIPSELLEQIIGECKKVVREQENTELPPVAVYQAELEKRLAAYMQSVEFQQDLSDLAQDYQHQGLPVPPEEQLREEAMGEARKCLESVMACEAKGHLWKEKADPENGTSDLTCRRCGASDHLQW